MSSAGETTRQIMDTLRAHVSELGDGLEKIVDDASAILELEVRRQASLADHSLKDLAALGHPYRVAGGGYGGATKTGRWRAGIHKAARTEREGSLGHDIKLVHVQSGVLQSAIERTVTRIGNVIWGRVSINTDTAPYAVYVITGTRKMIPRDFLGRGAVIARPRVLRTIREGLNGLFRQIKAAA